MKKINLILFRHVIKTTATRYPAFDPAGCAGGATNALYLYSRQMCSTLRACAGGASRQTAARMP
jgi:hypothetical protein